MKLTCKKKVMLRQDKGALDERVASWVYCLIRLRPAADDLGTSKASWDASITKSPTHSIAHPSD